MLERFFSFLLALQTQADQAFWYHVSFLALRVNDHKLTRFVVDVNVVSKVG
jgi:hypothetical protein